MLTRDGRAGDASTNTRRAAALVVVLAEPGLVCMVAETAAWTVVEELAMARGLTAKVAEATEAALVVSEVAMVGGHSQCETSAAQSSSPRLPQEECRRSHSSFPEE